MPVVNQRPWRRRGAGPVAGQSGPASCGFLRSPAASEDPNGVARAAAQSRCWCGIALDLAEGEGFEPSADQRPATVFETAAFDRSATPPGAEALGPQVSAQYPRTSLRLSPRVPKNEPAEGSALVRVTKDELAEGLALRIKPSRRRRDSNPRRRLLPP